MIELRPFEKLGKSNHGWLNANFHFSFAEYRNPERVHWGALRVWNNDRIAPQSGETVLNKLFASSFVVGKRVRTETALGEGAVSVSFAAVQLARKIFGKLEGRR